MKNKKNIALIVVACVLVVGIVGIGVTRRKEIKADKPSTVTETLAPTKIQEKIPEPVTTEGSKETPEPTTIKAAEETPNPTTTKAAEEIPEPTTTQEETTKPVITETETESPKSTTAKTETKVSEPTTTKKPESTTKAQEPKPIEKPITTEIDNKEETPSYDSSVPTADKEDHEGQVYDPVFGWVTVGDTIQDVVDSDGDIEKQIGTMGGN